MYDAYSQTSLHTNDDKSLSRSRKSNINQVSISENQAKVFSTPAVTWSTNNLLLRQRAHC